MRISFRADASLQMGSGHVMRCLTLADALRERGAQCQFICREHDGNLLELIRNRGHVAAALPKTASTDNGPAHSAWLGADWRTDAQQTRAALADSRVDWLIVDHYALDARWEQQLRASCKRLMVIDDMADRPHDCDLLLDQNLIADFARRYDGLVPARCGLMLGTHYALLQPQYAELHSRVPPRAGAVQRILIYFGAADRDNLTGRALDAFLSLGRSDIALDVVINPASPHAAALHSRVEGHRNVTVHGSVPSLASLMVNADLAIGAGGATSWERCCVGLPSLVITLADNQIPIAEELHRQGLVRYLGDKDRVDVTVLSLALAEIVQSGLTPEWSERCRALVDGRGTRRVSDILTLDASTPLRARPVQHDDETLLLQWANDPVVRRNAYHQDTIDPASHRTWFRKRLRDFDHCRIYILETQEGLPVGQVRFDRSEVWEIDYSLDPRVRGRGIGAPLLKSAINALRASVPDAPLLGRVKDSNPASCRVFESLGFDRELGREGELVYRLTRRL